MYEQPATHRPSLCESPFSPERNPLAMCKICPGVTEDLLSSFLFDEEHERQLTTYDKWRVVRHAAEQVLSVYANRSNAKWMESEQWTAPTVVDANKFSGSGGALRGLRWEI